MNTSSSTMDCCSHSQNDRVLLSACGFWVEGIMILFVGTFGIIGNLLSISVLLGKEMSSSVFNFLLIILATIDSLLITFAILDKSLNKAFNIDMGDIYNYLFPYFIYPITNIVLCSSIFMVVSIAFERYQAICHPYKYRDITNTQTVTSRVSKLTVPAIVLAIIINITKFLETELLRIPIPSAPNLTHIVVSVTDLRKNPIYINYYVNWFCLLSTGVIPMAALIYFNINIYLMMKARKKFRNSLQEQYLEIPEYSKNTRKEDKLFKRDLRMTMILVTIVLVFFSCHLPRVLLNLFEFFMVSKMISCSISKFCPPIWFLCAINFSHLMLVISSSVNILIYCIVGKKFRNGLKIKLHQLQYRLISSFTSITLTTETEEIAMPVLVYVTDRDSAMVQLEPRRGF